MEIPFVKYQGTGNDFILVDGRLGLPQIDVKHWCDRRFGIGADGLMILANSQDPKCDFDMIYYNSDGNLSSMCGNGGRCIAHWAKSLGIGFNQTLKFNAPDGLHEASFHENLVKLSMNPVSNINTLENGDSLLDTGSPHYVRMCSAIPKSFVDEAFAIRHSPQYKKDGINVNFYVKLDTHQLFCRTFERGVEDETLSCGTGVTAVALSFAKFNNIQNGKIDVRTRGGDLSVYFETSMDGSYHNIHLEGPATFVYRGYLK